jgi:hypothetical protein
VHEQSAQRHLPPQAREERGEAEWAEFERRCATLKGELAQLAADRADPGRLREDWLEQPSDAAWAAIRHRSAEITRQTEQL